MNFRLLAFETMPFDDYHSAILYLDGKNPDFYFFSPTCYRFVFLGLVYAVYEFIPLIPLSQFAEQDLDILRAIQAQCLVGFIFAQGFVWMLFFLMKNHLRISHVAAFGTAGLAQVSTLWVFSYGADTLYLFYVVLLLYFIEKKSIFFPLLLLSIIVNEKISLIFTVFFAATYLFAWSDKEVQKRLGMSIFSFSAYLFMKSILAFPGYENQTDASLIVEKIQASMDVIFNAKGLYMNVLPLLFLLFIFYLGKKEKVYKSASYVQNPSIWALPIAFFVLGMFVCTDYTIGRLVMHTLPFYLLVVGLLLEKMRERSLIGF